MMFNEWERTYNWHKTRRFSTYEFLDISAWKICSFLRKHINEWAVDFENDSDFMSKYKSKLNKQYYGAEFEMLLYNILKNQNFAIERHPDLGSKKKLDFKATTKEQQNILLECTLSGESFENISDKTQKEIVEEIIDEIEYYPYYINVGFEVISKNSFSKKKLLLFLEEVRKASEGIPNEQLFEISHPYEFNGWELKFSMLRKPHDKPIKRRSLGYIANGARTINTSKPLLTALNDKRPSKYGTIAAPYIICVNTSDQFASDICYSESLFGQYGQDKIYINETNPDRFFLNKHTYNTKVSAVLFFRYFSSYILDKAECSLWHNPFARFPLAENLLPFDEHVFSLKGDVIERKFIKKDTDVLNLLNVDKEAYVSAKAKIPDE